MIKRILGCLVVSAALLSADTLVLRNGTRVDGVYVGGDSHSLRFSVGGRVNYYNLSEIDSVRFSGGPQTYAPGGTYPPGQNYPQSQNYPPNQGYPQGQAYPQNAPPPDGNYPPPQNGTYSQSSNYPQPAAGPQGGYQTQPPAGYGAPPPPEGQGPAGIEVPAGTEIVVRLIDPVNSERDNLGQTYRATIDQPVVVNGQTVIPRGSDAVATLIDAKQSGKIEGRTVLTVDLKNVTVNGRTYDIVTTGVSRASGSRGERSAKVIGGAAALGAIIGAAAGGGRGAAIGAGSGAAVGTAAEVATSGQKVKIPAETRLTFTLQNPLDL
jgi:hypothetical protein